MAAPSILRPLSLGEVLDVSFNLYRRLLVPLLIIMIATRALPIAIEVYLMSAGGASAYPVLWLVNLLLSAVLGPLGAGASTFVVSENYLGRSLPADRALVRAVPYLWRLLVLAVATGLVVALGLLAFIVPGLILLAGLVLGTPALVLENLGGIRAMGRSWYLTQGYRGKVFWAVVGAVILVYLPSMALGAYASWTTVSAGVEGVAVNLGLTAALYVLSTLIYPLLYCVMTVTYYDLRVRKEGFDLEVLASGAGGG